MRKNLIFFFFLSSFLLFLLCTFSLFHVYSFTHPISPQENKIQREGMNLTFTNLLYATFFGIRPLKIHGIEDPSQYGLSYEVITFNSEDGILLKGWFVPKENAVGTVLLAHGYNGNKESLLNYVKFIHDAGYNVFVFDFRGAGESEGTYVSLGYYERYDILGAVHYLQTRNDVDNDNIMGFGFSMGGSALVFAQAEESVFSALILDSVYSSLYQNVARRFNKVYHLPKFPFATSLTFFGGILFGTNGFSIAPTKYIEQIYIPLFIIQGTEDEGVFVEDALFLFQHANKPKRVWIVDGAKHTGAYASNKELYESAILSFLDSSSSTVK